MSIEGNESAVSPLVSIQWLADHLEDPSVVILEVSIDPPTMADYAVGHIPGALFVYWKDLLWHVSDREIPSTEVVAERLRALGVNDDTTIALVGDPFQFAAYAYWVMTMSGQEVRCRLVDGGRRTWIDDFYNRRRKHSTNGMKSPIDYDTEHRNLQSETVEAA